MCTVPSAMPPSIYMNPTLWCWQECEGGLAVQLYQYVLDRISVFQWTCGPTLGPHLCLSVIIPPWGRTGWWEWLQLAISYPPGQSGSEKTPAGEAQVNSSLRHAWLSKTNALCCLKMVLFPSSPESPRRCLSGDLVGFLEVTMLWSFPMRGVSLQFLSIRLVHTEPPAVCWVSLRFSHHTWSPGCLLLVPAPVSGGSLYLSGCPSKLGDSDLPGPQLSAGSKRVADFSICSVYKGHENETSPTYFNV